MSTVIDAACCQMPHHRLVNTIDTIDATGTAYTKNIHAGNGTSAMVNAVNKIVASTNTIATDRR